MRRLFFSTLIILSLLAPAALHAQRVTGRVLDRLTGEPLAHTVVTLRNTAGETVQRTSTSADGLFRLSAPDSGPWTVHAERVGYDGAASRPLRLTAGATEHVELVIGVRAVALEAIVVTRDRTCEIHAGASDVARLWDEARTALAASATAVSERRVSYGGLAFQRRVSADGAVIRQQTQPFTMHAQQPYRSLEPAELEEQGFVHRIDGEYVFHAPSPETLLSPAFERTHCFSLRRSGRERLAIDFEPARTRRGIADIAGTVWVDAQNARLLSVDFRYVDAGVPYAEHAGGSVEFRMLPNGVWIVSSWSIRTPAVARGMTQGSRTSGLRVVELDETGGTVHLARSDGSEWRVAAPGAVAGVVVDSTRMMPLAGAVVHVEGTGLNARSGADGAFLIEGVPPGKYRVMLAHPRLDSLPIYPRAPYELSVAAGVTSELKVAVQPLSSSVIGSCLAELQPHTSILFGHVRDGAGERQPRARVTLAFDSLFITPEQAGSKRQLRSVDADQRGRIWSCGLPAQRPIDVTIRTVAGLVGHTQILLPPGAAFHELIVLEEPAEQSSARLARWRSLLGQQ